MQDSIRRQQGLAGSAFAGQGFSFGGYEAVQRDNLRGPQDVGTGDGLRSTAQRRSEVSFWKKEKPVRTSPAITAVDEEIRQERGKLATNIVNVERARSHLENLMAAMLKEVHETGKK